MKQAIKFLFLMVAVTCAWSCHSPSAGKGAIISYVEDPGNGLCNKVRAGNCIYTIQYRPSAYILELEHPGSDSLAAARAKQLDSMAWFTISFRVAGFEQSPLRYQVTGLEEYQARQNYYLNEAPGDIYLLYGSDTLYLNSYWFENNQNLTPSETMILGFRLEKDARPVRDMHLVFYDRVFRNGIIKTIIRKEALEQLPDFSYFKK